MKSILIIIILIIEQNINSQFILEGLFVLDIKSSMHGEEFTFKNDGTFEYYEWGDLLPNNFGKGTYEIHDTILLLKFIDIPEMHDTVIFIDNEFQSEGDTVKYEVHLLDFKTKLPIQYGSVRLLYENNNHNERAKKNVFLIQDYEAENIIFSKKEIPSKLLFSSLSGLDVKYNIYDSLSRNMRVYIKDLKIALDYIKPKQEKIKIRKITDENFELYKYKQWCKYTKYSK